MGARTGHENHVKETVLFGREEKDTFPVRVRPSEGLTIPRGMDD